MRPVSLTSTALSLLIAGSLLAEGAPAATAQDSSGRQRYSVPDPPARTRLPRKRTGKPKKVIRAMPKVETDRTPTASVVIRSYPPGAQVLFDGREVGTTGDDGELELSDIRLGQHRIVLKKDGFREWAQTVTVTSAAEAQEFEPLLQAESPQYFRSTGKIPAVDVGRDVRGEIGRDGFPMRDGSGFYNEYLLRVAEPGAFLMTVKGEGIVPVVRIVDEGDRPYGVDKIGGDVYQSVVLPTPGNYYIQISAPVDESTLVAGGYTIKVLEERTARGESTLKIGDSVQGALEATDRSSGPEAYYDVWSFDAAGGERVRVVATSADFVPAVTLLQDGKAVTASGKSKKKSDSSSLVWQLKQGRYTVYVRSASGPKLGSYQLAVTPE
jgi:hypothetical protein